MLLLAVQVATGLLVTSTATAAGHDAVRRVAARHVDHHAPAQLQRAQRDAERGIAAHLGASGDRATFRWRLEDGWLTLTVGLPLPEIAPAPIHGALGFDERRLTFSAPIEAHR